MAPPADDSCCSLDLAGLHPAVGGGHAYRSGFPTATSFFKGPYLILLMTVPLVSQEVQRTCHSFRGTREEVTVAH